MIKNRAFKFCKSLFLLLSIIVFSSHDLFIKMDNYFLQPNQEATLSLYNGTFEKSENIITRDRIIDASFIVLGERRAINEHNWNDLDSTVTQLNFTTGEEGTYVAGVSTKGRNIELSAEKFNSYLESDGVFDMLEQRKVNGFLEQDAVENYQKHVKTIYQVGDAKSNDWSVELGYPIEFIPQANPYNKHSGETLDVQLLLDGKPLSDQLVFADYIKSVNSHSHNNHSHEHDGEAHSHKHSPDDGEHTHTHESEEVEAQNEHGHAHEHDGEAHSHDSEDGAGHTHTSGQQLRTNAQGIVTIDLPEDGIYYLRTIYMTRATDSEELTHRSKWATLTFEVSHSHDANTHTHDEDGVPLWIFIVGSIFIVGILFLIFRKKDN